jgi:diguanylate cyclase (GGDEF)-like protein
MNDMNLSIQTKLFLSHFLAIILVSGSVGSYFYNSAIDNLISSLQSRLQNSAALVSQGLQVANLDQINSADDTNKAGFQQGVTLLRDFVKVNSDIAFIYVMKQVNNEVVFILDSDTNEPALPGDVYEDVNPQLLEGFIRPSVDSEITTDKWGSFLSGYAPLKMGKTSYLLGIDMRADQVEAKLVTLKLTGLLSFFLSITLAIIFSRMLSKGFLKRINKMKGRMSSIAPDSNSPESGIKGDELKNLTVALEDMSARLDTKQKQLDQNETALKMAKQDLEQRVEERTYELVNTNQQLLQEIAERARVEQKLETLSQTDHLTGLLNRRALSNQLETHSKKTTSTSHYYSLIMIDLDNFKGINDNYGHDIGDDAIQYSVASFKTELREHDLLSRWGGEEFLIMLPETLLDEASAIAQRLCDSLADAPFMSKKGKIILTASFGVSRYHFGEDLNLAIKRADDALYQAKAHGRNCIVVKESDY